MQLDSMSRDYELDPEHKKAALPAAMRGGSKDAADSHIQTQEEFHVPEYLFAFVYRLAAQWYVQGPLCAFLTNTALVLEE
ncbi:hypothetical protein HBI56_168670 [Parastagonospora nodorum]|nr:hypothetical protein HBH56_050090 [Parastagonospora nodorum]KAH3935744.1 hypothetical protein HBH54_035880 [Parastagonospora nodorum]KAH3942625.1 hypothetical protein HBH53_184100 [Parastagonospora nodorum]KAH3964053.1 hypothetical protein HBH51_161730 [Parastagonospora nodorum]KAH3989156.1 hypothetical protein HBH52_025050 [Parastagonospora nodorum]